jgi:hypothetical protein
MKQQEHQSFKGWVMNPTIPGKRIRTFASLCIALLGVGHLTHGSTLLTFDDLSPGTDYVVVSNYYGGLLWGNFGVLDGSLRPSSWYHNGVVSPPNVAFNLAGNRAAFSSINGFFDLNSAYLTSQFVDGLQIRVQGLAGTNLLYDNSYVLTTNAPILINFNYSQVDTVRFVTPSSTWFVLDNLSITLTNGPVTANCSAPASAPLHPGMVQGWGCNYVGQINTACFSNVVAIAAGGITVYC